MALKSVKQRLEDWLPNNMPLGCGSTESASLTAKNTCSFDGTNADFQQFRQQWITNCAATNATGLLQSKKNAYGQCQNAFDNATSGIQFANFSKNREDLADIQANNEKLQKTAAVALVGVLVIGLIVWLLTSK